MNRIFYSFLFFVFVSSNISYTGGEEHYIENFNLFEKDIIDSYELPFNLAEILNDNFKDNLNAIQSSMQCSSKAMFLVQKQNTISTLFPFSDLLNVTLEKNIEEKIDQKIEKFIQNYKEKMQKAARDEQTRIDNEGKNYNITKYNNFFKNDLKDIFNKECKLFIRDIKAHINQYCVALLETFEEHYRFLANHEVSDDIDKINDID